MAEKIQLSGVPETIAVGEELLPESGTITQIAMSAMDDWGGRVVESDTPVLVIIEGLTMYLSETDVKRIFAVIAGRFPQATVLVETLNPMVVKRFKERSIEGSNAKFTWGVKDGRTLAALLPLEGKLWPCDPAAGAGLPCALRQL